MLLDLVYLDAESSLLKLQNLQFQLKPLALPKSFLHPLLCLQSIRQQGLRVQAEAGDTQPLKYLGAQLKNLEHDGAHDVQITPEIDLSGYLPRLHQTQLLLERSP